MPESVVAMSAGGQGWTRAEVDELGTLRLLRHPKHFKAPTEAGDDAARKKALLAAETEAEATFLKILEEGGAPLQELLKAPSYEDHAGKLYNHDGEPVATVDDISAWRTDELLPLRCPHPATACKMATLIRQVPPALGEPVFDRLEAKLAHAMLSLPATKGFEFGSGFSGTRMRGSQHNDPFVAPTSESALTQSEGSALSFKSNFAGGTLGGISSGADIYFRVAVKPVSTIGQAQHTAAYDGSNVVLEAKGRHDPCVLPRTPPLVESMASLVLADAAMLQRTRLGGGTTTACDGSTNFVPPEHTNGDGPSSKKPRTA
ncbi:MAG: hypothetical protein SGPRY_012292 [Prymnesium sp.]